MSSASPEYFTSISSWASSCSAFDETIWVLSDGSLKIVSSNAEQEEAHEEIEVKYSGDALDIGFNVNYLLDVLNNVPGATIDCAFGDSSSSALLSYASEKDFKYVVMPMRI